MPKKITFQAKNIKILHRLQYSLTNISGIFLDICSSLYQILVCNTVVLHQLWQLWNFFQSKIANESLYNTSIRAIRQKLPELQNDNK